MDLLANKPPRKRLRLLHRRVSARLLLVLAILGWSGILFAGGALAYRAGLVGVVKRAFAPQAPAPTPKCPVEAAEAPVLEILMGDKAYRKIVDKRNEFLAGGLVMVHDSSDYVSAYVRMGQDAEPLKANVRLTGNMVDRIRDPKKWSFRIELDDTATLLGMTAFNIQPPWARDYLSEWYFMQALRQEGLISSRYTFVRVFLNNQDLGIYGLEEHPDWPLLENNGRPEAPILRFDQDAFWQEWATFTDAIKTNWGTGSGSFWASNIRPYSPGAVADSAAALDVQTEADAPTLAADFYAGTALLEAFRQGKLPASEVFDVPLTARYFALCDLFGAWHALNWNMLRFYYNPLSGRVEPVGLNAYNDYTGASILQVGLLGEGIEQYNFARTPELHAKFFADEAFARAYVQELERLSSSAWLDAFFAGIREKALGNYALLYAESPEVDCTGAIFYANAEHIRRVLNPNTKGVQAYFEGYAPGDAEGEGASVTLQLANMQRLAVQVLDLTLGGQRLFPVAGTQANLPGRRGAMTYVSVTFACPSDLVWSAEAQQGMTLAYHLLGTALTNRHESAVFAWHYSMSDAYIEELLAERQPNVDAFPFLQVDESASVIHVLPGDWTITRTVNIPAGYELRCGPDTRLHLRDGASLFSRSRLVFYGDEEAPIVLDGDGTGGGVMVLDAPGTSTLENVVFVGLDAPTVNGIPVYGTVTFQASASEWYRCQILEARGQEALHIVRSTCAAEELLIQDASEGGFLGGLSTITLTNAAFVRVGRDAIKTQSSTLGAQGITVDGAKGCALSASEGSAVTVTGMVVQDCMVGLTSVDCAVLDINQTVIRRCAFGLAAYQGQTTWGPAQMDVAGLTLEGNTQDFVLEVGSEMTVDGVAQTKVESNVATRLGE